MKFEVRTENDRLTKSFSYLILISIVIFLIFTLSSISIKLGKISKHYEINYLCKLLIVEKSSFNFRKLSKLSNQTSKQKMGYFCKAFLNDN